MIRAWAPLLLGALLLAGCSSEREPDAKTADPVKAVAAAPIAGGAVESEFGTPVKDRVATIGLLNKRNNLTQLLVLKTGEARRIGNVIVRLASCERTLPWERPSETGAFVQVYVEERAKADDPLQWRRVFSGWLFKESPSLNVVEHPVYDVWVKECAMKFPGEEVDPPAADSTAPKPSGSASAAPAPSPKPSATATAAPSPSVALD